MTYNDFESDQKALFKEWLHLDSLAKENGSNAKDNRRIAEIKKEFKKLIAEMPDDDYKDLLPVEKQTFENIFILKLLHFKVKMDQEEGSK